MTAPTTAPKIPSKIPPTTAQKNLSEKLFHFQKVGANFLYSRGQALLADEMGLGKTIQVLAAVHPDEGVVIVCPTFLMLNWRAEAARWRPDLVVLPAGADFFPKAGEVLITAYSRLPPAKDEDAEDAFPRWNQPLPTNKVWLVLDEAHYVKSAASQRTARVRALAQVCDRVAALTGTPMVNRPPELWALLQALHWSGKPVFGSWENMVRIFGGRKKHFGGYDWNGVVTPEVPDRLKRIMLRRTRAEVLPEIPTKVRRDLVVPIAKTGTLGQDFHFIDGWPDEKVEKEATQPRGALFSVRAELAEAKHEALGELLQTYADAAEPVVVFSSHERVIRNLSFRDRFVIVTGATPMAAREVGVRMFQEGKLSGIAGTVGALGVGVTLTRACHVVMVDRPWTPAEEDQAEDRVCRIGQTRPVMVTRLVADHPVDRRVQSVLDKKRKLLEGAGL